MALEYLLIGLLTVFTVLLSMQLTQAKEEAKFNLKIKEHFEKEFFTVLKDIEDSMNVSDSKKFLQNRINRRANDILKKLIEGVDNDNNIN